MRRSFRVSKNGNVTEYTIINNDEKMLDELGWDVCNLYKNDEDAIIIDELIETKDNYINKQYIIDDLKSYNDFIAMLENINVRITRTRNGFIVER